MTLHDDAIAEPVAAHDSFLVTCSSRQLLSRRIRRSAAELTMLGRSLVGVFRQLKDWADLNMDEVAQSRQTYDSRKPTG